MIVFVDLGEHRYLRRVVRTGRKAGSLIEVTDGLVAGDAVVSGGAFFLKSELAKDELGEGHAH
jgi:cobalt-zinc-cadmium efflux system membrane fusion protein